MAESAVVESAATYESAGQELVERRISPAAHLSDRFEAAEVTGARGVSLRELPFQTMVGVRVVRGSEVAFRVEAQLGTSLPPSCGSVSQGEGLAVLWLAPDEFLVVSEGDPAVLTSTLVEAVADGPGSATDLSANRTTFVLSGPSAREVLEKGCGLDLHPRAFADGSAYVTALGPVPSIIWKTGAESYRILPRSSFADFLGRWLLDAMVEYRAPELC
ncbi:MAG: sarcosine oxidase subunit gamma family protein [Microlunatus sp.]